MNKTKSLIAIGLLAMFALGVPFPAVRAEDNGSSTIDALLSQLQSLLAQVQSLQEQLNALNKQRGEVQKELQ